jgi:hypothetical protein
MEDVLPQDESHSPFRRPAATIHLNIVNQYLQAKRNTVSYLERSLRGSIWPDGSPSIAFISSM